MSFFKIIDSLDESLKVINFLVSQKDWIEDPTFENLETIYRIIHHSNINDELVDKKTMEALKREFPSKFTFLVTKSFYYTEDVGHLSYEVEEKESTVINDDYDYSEHIHIHYCDMYVDLQRNIKNNIFILTDEDHVIFEYDMIKMKILRIDESYKVEVSKNH